MFGWYFQVFWKPVAKLPDLLPQNKQYLVRNNQPVAKDPLVTLAGNSMISVHGYALASRMWSHDIIQVVGAFT